MSRSGMLCHIFIVLLLKVAFMLSVEVVVPKGSDLTLACHDDKVPEIRGGTFKWTFRPRNSTLRNRGWEGSKFARRQIHKSDEGEYECLIKGYIGDSQVKISRTFNVSVVLDTSSFKQWLVIAVTEGDVADLPCSPPANADWLQTGHWLRATKEGVLEPLQPLVMNENYIEGKERVYWAKLGDDMSIKIFSSKVQDAGMYYCQFQEGTEIRAQLVELEVEVPPPPRCFGHTEPWELCETDMSRTAGDTLSESLTDFSTKLYSQLRTASTGNLLYSPVSIAGVLSHLLLGARDSTRKMMEDALCLPRGFSCTHQALRALREETQESLDMASHIFYSPGQILSETFFNQSKEFYEAAPTKLTNDSEQNLQMINNWVAEKTKNKIPKLVDSVDPFSELILVNAVYFLGKWKLKFNGNSRPGIFTTLNGDMVHVNTLHDVKYKLSMQSSSRLRAQVGAFPLSGRNRLFILVPVTFSLKDLQAVEERMTDTVLREMAKDMAKVSPVAAEVTLPKLKLDISTNLNKLFEDIGLGELFREPNLCGLFPETELPVALTDARHRASLTLSESGVEAAATTSMSFARSFPSFSAMQPFILVLWSDQANCPLFMGRVTRP